MTGVTNDVVPVEAKVSPAGGSSIGAELPYLDGIRAVAVLFVFIRHAWGLSGEPDLDFFIGGFRVTLAPFVMMMSSGVDLFFVLSGFLLAQRFFLDRARGRPTDLRVYARRRFFRIFPPYWVVLGIVLIFLVPGAVTSDLVYSDDGAVSVIAHVFAMQTLVPLAFGSFGGVASPFWTLTIEILFYAVLPFVVRAFFGVRLWKPLLAAFLISFAWLWLARNGPSFVGSLQSLLTPASRPTWSVQYQMSHNLPSYAFTFACGIAAAKVFVDHRLGAARWVTQPRNATLVLVGSIGLLGALMWWMGTASISGTFTGVEPLITGSTSESRLYFYMESIPYGIAYAGIILGVAFSHQWVRKGVSVRALTIFGVAGYGFYLMHMPILRNIAFLPWVFQLPEFVKLITTLMLAGSLTLFVSYWFHRLVELPYIARGRGDVGPEPMFTRRA